MKKWFIMTTAILSSLTLYACAESSDDTLPSDQFLFIYDMLAYVDETTAIELITNLEDTSSLSFDYDERNILIDGLEIYGIRAGTQTQVTVTLNQLETTFTVIIPDDSVTVSNPLFDPITIDEIPLLKDRDDFIMGVDISSIVEVTNRGGKFYDALGQRVSIYQLLKENGVNYVRIRLWNDPNTTSGIPYGGGNNDLDVAIDIGRNAKRFGMKILLNFHYSDFWADPGKQVIPKAWANLTTAQEIASEIYDFTYQSLQAMEDAHATVDMVQIGNEIAPGLLTQGTSNYDTLNTDNPSRFSLPSSISGSTGNLDNFILYLDAGLRASKDQNPDILRMIHIDRGGNHNFYVTYFDRIAAANLDYEIIGMSYYVFYHGLMQNFDYNIKEIAKRYQKPIVVAETSYAFTNQNVANASHILTSPHQDYPLSVQGQADNITDIIRIVAEVDDDLGLGIFYWEPAWLPVAGAGWAGAGSPVTWANQALFSYQGVMLPSLELFRKVIPSND